MRNKIKTISNIERLRLNIIHNQVTEICNQGVQAEINNPHGYDIKESLAAISHYRELASKIEANTVKEYMRILKYRVDIAQNNCSFPGEYSGGVGTYGSLQAKLSAWYEDELMQCSVDELMQLVQVSESS